MNLIIVESPSKAKTISKYLGSGFKVLASVGHIRDLPSKSGSVLPNQDFDMKYELSSKAAKYVDSICREALNAKSIILATDPDREGESIAWHIVEVLKIQNAIKPRVAINRVVFHEITKKAVLAAIKHPREIDNNLVNAQQARRALDYLVGFTLSPLLWRKLPGCKSAGRVQSVALRLICEREEEVEKFKSEEYWSITAEMEVKNGKFKSKLDSIDAKKLEKFSITTKKQAENITNQITNLTFFVNKQEKKSQKRNPYAPFITSTIQQEAARRLQAV